MRHAGLTELQLVEDMHTRKQRLLAGSDAVVGCREARGRWRSFSRPLPSRGASGWPDAHFPAYLRGLQGSPDKLLDFGVALR